MENTLLELLTNNCFILAIVLLIILYFVESKGSENQIRKDIERRGGKFISKEWYAAKPRFIRNYVTSYRVRYIDSGGSEHIAICKPGIGGIFWEEDKLIIKDTILKNNPK
jgi:hypothetical protein